MDSTRDVVQHFTLNGTYLGQFGAKCSTPCAANQFGGPFDIAATGGYLFVAEQDNDRISTWKLYA